MASPTIKFSHLYTKMPFGYGRSTLLDVIPIRLEDLSPAFLEYDTKYVDDVGETHHYQLPECGLYMILLLRAESGLLWTTIRRKSMDKLRYYQSLIGERVCCEVI